jgi:hypothetical protein
MYTVQTSILLSEVLNKYLQDGINCRQVYRSDTVSLRWVPELIADHLWNLPSTFLSDKILIADNFGNKLL